MLINLKRATPGEGEPDLKFAALRIHEMGSLSLFPSCTILLLKMYWFKCLVLTAFMYSRITFTVTWGQAFVPVNLKNIV